MVGQEKLILKINSLTLDTFPHTLLLVGERGSGKHLIVDYIGNHFGFEVIDVTDDISLELIDTITLRIEPKIYLIDGTLLTEKKENVLLKFLEEPVKNSFIIILCEAPQQLLPTIINRCRRWDLAKYSKLDLSQFLDDPNGIKAPILLDDVANTPGQIIEFQKQDLTNIIGLCNTIIDKIAGANCQNTLTITNKIAFNHEEEKYDFDCFVRCMLYSIRKRIVENNSLQNSFAFVRTKQLESDRYIHNINLINLFNTYLIDMKGIYEGKGHIVEGRITIRYN